MLLCVFSYIFCLWWEAFTVPFARSKVVSGDGQVDDQVDVPGGAGC